MVDVGDTAHGDEGNIVQDPPDHRIDTGVMDLVDFGRFKVVIPSLPTDQVPGNEETKDTQRSGASPINDRVTQEEIFDD